MPSRQVAPPAAEQNPVGVKQGQPAPPAAEKNPVGVKPLEGQAQSKQAASDVKSPEELADIWRDVCQEASANKPLLNILYDCVPAEQKGDEIKLVVGLGMTKDIVERDIAYINSLVKRFGADGHIVCVLDTGSGAAGQGSSEGDAAGGPDAGGTAAPGAGEESDLEMARREASELLGIDVQIEE